MFFSCCVLVTTIVFSQDGNKNAQPEIKGIAEIKHYLSQIKSKAEAKIQEFVDHEQLLATIQDTSNGNSERAKAIVIAKLDLRNKKLTRDYDNLVMLVNSFITGIEDDLTIANKTKLKQEDQYRQALLSIDTAYNKFRDDKNAFDESFASEINQATNTIGKEAAGGSDAFSLTSLIPSPLTIAEDIVAIFQARRDFRAQQIQTINAGFENLRLSSSHDIKSGGSTAAADAPAGSDDSSTKSKKKSGGKKGH